MKKGPDSKDKFDELTTPSAFWYFLLIAPLVIYIIGLAPSTVFGDSGDYQAAGWLWGVSHPPGYPLYTILVGIFEHLPISPFLVQTTEFSAPAWRSNLLSVFFALAALAALFALVRRLTGNPVVAVCASGALAFSRIFWWHAEIAENDTMSAMFIFLVLLLAIRIVQERRKYDPFLLALVLGLAVSHHQSIVLFTPAIVVYLLYNGFFRFNPTRWLAYILIFILGLAPFLYLPLSQYRTPDGPLQFVSSSEFSDIYNNDPERITLERFSTDSPSEYFFNYIGRTIYSSQRVYTHTPEALGDDVTTTWDVLLFHLKTIFEDFGYLLPFAGFFALFFGWRYPGHDRKINPAWLILFTAWIFYFLITHFYPSGDILHAPRYNLDTAGPGLLLPLELIFAGFIGLGLSNVLSLNRISGKRQVRKIFLWVVMCTCLFNFFTNNYYSDKSKHTITHEYTLNVLDSAPENSTLIVAGDELYPFWYMHYVHGYRPDVRIEPWTGNLEDLSELTDISDAMASAVVRISESDPDRRIVTTFFNSSFLEKPALRHYSMARRGILFEFVPPGQTDEYTPVNPELARQTGLDYYLPALPESYRYDFWGGSEFSGDEALHPLHVDPLWPPEADIQWRTGEMLLFYGTVNLFDGNNLNAEKYFGQMWLVEPGNEEVLRYLELARGSQ